MNIIFFKKLIYLGIGIGTVTILVLLVVLHKQNERLKYLSNRTRISSPPAKITPKPLVKLDNATPYLIRKAKEKAKNLEQMSSPDYATYIKIGEEYYKAGDLKKAIKNYKKALELNPNSSEIYEKLAEVYEEKGKIDKAEKFYINSLILTFNSKILLKLSDLYFFRSNKKYKAIRLLEDNLEKHPSINLIIRLGDYYKFIGDFEKAKHFYQLALKKDSTNTIVKFKLKSLQKY